MIAGLSSHLILSIVVLILDLELVSGRGRGGGGGGGTGGGGVSGVGGSKFDSNGEHRHGIGEYGKD